MGDAVPDGWIGRGAAVVAGWGGIVRKVPAGADRAGGLAWASNEPRHCELIKIWVSYKIEVLYAESLDFR